MPLYLDVHNKIDGLTTQGLAESHKKDLAVQGKYGVNYIRYWYDEGTGKVFCLCQAPSKEAAAAVHREAHGKVFCLCQAPSKEAAAAVHREAHGIVADEIIEVKEGS